MKWIIITVLIVMSSVVSQARHINPHGKHTAPMEKHDSTVSNEDDYADIVEIRAMKPVRFVPINNAMYFKNYEPCEEGYARDRLGVCREIWN